MLAVLALMAGCSSAPLTKPAEILTQAQTNLKNLKSVHFHLEAGGQFLMGIEQPQPTPTAAPTDTPAPSESAGPSLVPCATSAPSASASAAASTSPAASASAKASASATASAAATPCATPTPTPTPSPTASPTPVPTPSVSPSPTPSPIYTAIPISLGGARADGDLDWGNNAAHVIGGLPGLPGLDGEVYIYQQYAYVRGYGEKQFLSENVAQLTLSPLDASGPAFIVQQILAVALDPGVSPVLVGTESEPGGQSYHIRVDFSRSALNSSHSQTVIQALPGTGKLDLWITTGGLQLERLEVTTTSADAGAAAVRLQLSNWNGVPLITPPPPSEIQSVAPPVLTQ
jgi:hypothetical protein